MGRRRCAAPLVFALIALIMSGCHASTEVSSDRSLAVCVGIQSSSGLGPTRPASAARVFAIVNGNEVDLAFDEVDGECARFTADLFMSDEVSSITAFDPSVGASTLIDVSADELRLRLADTSQPIEGASTVTVRGEIIRSESGTSASISGEGIDNSYLYGDYINDLYREEGQERFEFVVGGWEGATPTEIYFLESMPDEDFSDLPKIAVRTVSRGSDSHDILVDFNDVNYDGWRHVVRRARFADGILSCGLPGFMRPLAYAAPLRRKPEVVQASIECDENETIHLDGPVIDFAKWIVQNFYGRVDEVPGYASGYALVDTDNNEDYIIPNIYAFQLDVFDDDGVSGAVSISGATTSSFISLDNIITVNEREFVWSIFTERNDGMTIDRDEYALILERIKETIDIQGTDYTLVIRDGYEGKPWETAPVQASRHHSIFGMQILPSDPASP